MTDIPEHLLKRAAERRAALENAEASAASSSDPAAPSSDPAASSEASSSASEQEAGGTAVATVERPGTAAARATGGARPAPPTIAGAGGHTQRLLTVVKAGSIQDVKATPTDKVNVWPHLLVVEFGAALAMTAFLTIFSTFVNAPLLAAANYNLTPNPSKAPWYFLGLQ
jgi:hypothetical protein